ncbi:GTPase-associated system all-helical protein GASH [Phyllobacterium chamaecytisi]|uniref:GTPase-associated system all-helical protein GASH n=1 Tax=Phyllobacterium chamaecytisi TaxID=2876082 RepID=UPI001CCC3E20|nr:GTPase-associated system all-helical protein GASH [Phyllobacterium sp. KW56]MBZ9603340.1 hypothetical protein [Phyllobacterium sp. KW56]
MSDSVLLQLLSQGLIDVRGDDAKLEKLETTAADLAALLKKDPSKTIPYVLVACDPAVRTDDEVVLSVVEALKSRWPTYVNTFSGTPIAVIRAMLLQALALSAKDEDRIGVAFVNTARNVLPLTEADNEQGVWHGVIGSLEEKIDGRAETEWATPDQISFAPMRFEAPALNEPTVKRSMANRDYLKKNIQAAAGPHYHDNQTGNVATNGNPYWPQNAAQWNTEFGQRMASAVGDVIDGVVKSVSVELPDVSAPLTALAQSASEYVGAAVAQVGVATVGLQRRTNLLWWKESLFSPSARINYRALSPAAAAALMAFDLHNLVPTFSPASVSSFLHEAVVALPGYDSGKEYRILELADEIKANPSLRALREHVAEPDRSQSGRMSVTSFVGSAPTLEGFAGVTGVSPDTQLTLPAWSAWIFRELQASRAVSEARQSPKRTRKG